MDEGYFGDRSDGTFESQDRLVKLDNKLLTIPCNYRGRKTVRDSSCSALTGLRATLPVLYVVDVSRGHPNLHRLENAHLRVI